MPCLLSTVFPGEAIIKADATINTEQNSASTSVIKMDDKLIIILDFEKIVTDISRRQD